MRMEKTRGGNCRECDDFGNTELEKGGSRVLVVVSLSVPIPETISRSSQNMTDSTGK